MVSEVHKLAFTKNYCPKITFHPHEQYFPCSIQHLLRDSTLKRRPRGSLETLDTVIVNSSADNVGDFVDHHSDYFVELASSQLQCCLSADKAVDAPMIVSVVEIDGSYGDIYSKDQPLSAAAPSLGITTT